MALYAFISDLHLGEGGPREDFYLHGGAAPADAPVSAEARWRGMDRLHAIFGEFLEWLRSEAARRGESPHLVILGDFLDLLQARDSLASPEDKAASIITAHAPVMAHLRNFSDAGGLLSCVIGNHDHELFAPEVWAALRRELPAVNAATDGQPAGWFAAPEAALYAEHGHQFDPVNAFQNFGDPAQTTVGAEIVRHIVNPCEDRFPLLDNLPGTRATLWYALRNLPALLGESLRGQWRDTVRLLRQPDGPELPLAEIAQHLAHLLLLYYTGASSRMMLAAVAQILLENESLLRAALKSALPPRGLLASVSMAGRHPLRVLARATEDDVRRGAESVLRGKREAETLGPPPENCRIVICGHTHQAGLWPVEGGWYANTGTWRPVARPWGRSAFRIEQPLNAVIVGRNRRGEWRPCVIAWGERK